MMRSCDSAVVCRRSIASVATVTAVSKPKVACVHDRSLSIVFGTPTIGMPFLRKRVAIRKAPSPPIAISASPPTSLEPAHDLVRDVDGDLLAVALGDELERVALVDGAEDRAAEVGDATHLVAGQIDQAVRAGSSSPW